MNIKQKLAVSPSTMNTIAIAMHAMLIVMCSINIVTTQVPWMLVVNGALGGWAFGMIFALLTSRLDMRAFAAIKDASEATSQVIAEMSFHAERVFAENVIFRQVLSDHNIKIEIDHERREIHVSHIDDDSSSDSVEGAHRNLH
jgi:hypothetical protein